MGISTWTIRAHISTSRINMCINDVPCSYIPLSLPSVNVYVCIYKVVSIYAGTCASLCRCPAYARTLIVYLLITLKHTQMHCPMLCLQVPRWKAPFPLYEVSQAVQSVSSSFGRDFRQRDRRQCHSRGARSEGGVTDKIADLGRLGSHCMYILLSARAFCWVLMDMWF